MREICILGVADLPWLYQRPELFVNKFFSDFEYLAYDCLEELIWKRTLQGESALINRSYYSEIPYVKDPQRIVAGH